MHHESGVADQAAPFWYLAWMAGGIFCSSMFRGQTTILESICLGRWLRSPLTPDRFHITIHLAVVTEVRGAEGVAARWTSFSLD